MERKRLAELNRQAMIRLCHSGLDSRTLRVELLQRLRPIIPFDYAYFTTTDPATHLSTSSVLVEEPPSWCMSVFLENEFLKKDFNKFSMMFTKHQPVGILSEATRYELDRSPRYREMLIPMAMEDELRAIFVTDAACRGTLCLHREKAKSQYTDAEANSLAQLVPHIADGLRKALLLSSNASVTMPEGPGVLILNEDLSVAAMTGAAEYWLMELTEMEQSDRYMLPVSVRSVVTALKAIENRTENEQSAPYPMPKVRLHMRTGQWLVLYASRLKTSMNPPHQAQQSQIGVIFEIAQPTEIAPLIMQAYDLTKREGEVTRCVLRGWSTREIASQLHISEHTVQDHLKAIFEKVAVGSRGELAARIFTQQYQP